jgi:hypothetical protein
MKKEKNIFVLEIHAYRGGMCQDVGYWTHASPNLNLLKEFVQEIMGPNRDMGSPFVLLKMKINKYTQIKGDALHQWNGNWITSSIDDADILGLNKGYSLFLLNDTISRLCFAKTKKDIRECELRLAKEYEDLWKNVDEKIKY